MRFSVRTIAAVAAVAAVAAAAGWTLGPGRFGGGADAGDARQVALGESVYREHCAGCHGAGLEGQPEWRVRKPDGKLPAPPHDATGHTWHHPDDQLFRITKVGLGPPLAPKGYASDMPGFGPVLTDDQIWAVLAFIKSRWPAPIRSRQDAISGRSPR